MIRLNKIEYYKQNFATLTKRQLTDMYDTIAYVRDRPETPKKVAKDLDSLCWKIAIRVSIGAHN